MTDRRLDLDAARAARAEKTGPAPVVVFEGVEYQLPPELPMEAVLAVAEDLRKPNPHTVRAALEAVFGEHWPALRSKLSVPDSMLVLTGVVELYGTDLGESKASASS